MAEKAQETGDPGPEQFSPKIRLQEEGYCLISGPGKERPRRTMIRWSWRRRILTVTRGSWTKDFPTYYFIVKLCY